MNTHIPKIIHISWKNKDILKVNHVFPQNCIQKLVELAVGWLPVVSDDADVEQYIRDNLSIIDYQLIKDRHIVEKIDVWRLIKLYNEGGLYSDIDRLCNTSINDLIEESTRVVLPECADSDFSQDFMCSAPGNPMFLEALHINLSRRRAGCRDIYLLGPQTYFHGITKAMTGEMIPIQPDLKIFEHLRNIIDQSGFITTYRETPPYHTIMYRPENPQINFDHEAMKRDFYAKCNLKHWTGDW